MEDNRTKEEEIKIQGPDEDTTPEENISEDAPEAAEPEEAGKAENAEETPEDKEPQEADEAPEGEKAESAGEAPEKSGAESAEDNAESSEKEKSPFRRSVRQKKELQKKDEQIKELTDRLLRTQAEFDNYRKRTDKEKALRYDDGAMGVLIRLLEVVDDFERGLGQIPEEQKHDPFAEGMEKIYKHLMTALEDLGVKPIDALDHEFDPEFHNAVMHVDEEGRDDNIVVEEFQKGYMYKDSVLRHSMVKVAN